MNLQPILPQVAHHLHLSKPQSKLRQALNKVEYLGMFLGGGGIALMMGTALFALLALAFLGPDAKRMSALWASLFGVGLLMLLKGAFLIAIPWFTKEFFPAKQSTPIITAVTQELPATISLEPGTSIAEHTTHTLNPLLAERVKQSRSS